MQRIAVIAGSSLSDTPPAPPASFRFAMRCSAWKAESSEPASQPLRDGRDAGHGEGAAVLLVPRGNLSTYYRTPAGKTLVDQHAAKSLVG